MNCASPPVRVVRVSTRRPLAGTVLLLLPVLHSGCGTLRDVCFETSYAENRLQARGPHVYGGVRLDFRDATDPDSWCRQFAGCLLLDIFCSFPVDTLLLPFTALYALFGPGEDPLPPPPPKAESRPGPR